MTFDIAIPTAQDAVSITDTHIRAMDSNELLRAKYPDVECWLSLQESIRKNTLAHIADGHDKCILVARDHKTGQIASFVEWIVQRRGESDGAHDEAAEEQWPTTCRTQIVNNYTTTTLEARREIMGNKPYYHVTFVCTDPAWGGRGAAKKVLGAVLDKAAEEGVPVVLESTMPAVAFYQKLGFQIRRGLDLMIPHGQSNEPIYRYSEQVMVWTDKPSA